MLCLDRRGAIGEIPERLQSGGGGCEAGGGRLLAVGNAVGAGVGVWECLWGRVRQCCVGWGQWMCVCACVWVVLGGGVAPTTVQSGCLAQVIESTGCSRDLLGSGVEQSNAVPVRCMSVLHALHRTETAPGGVRCVRGGHQYDGRAVQSSHNTIPDTLSSNPTFYPPPPQCHEDGHPSPGGLYMDSAKTEVLTSNADVPCCSGDKAHSLGAEGQKGAGQVDGMRSGVGCTPRIQDWQSGIRPQGGFCMPYWPGMVASSPLEPWIPFP